MVIGPGFGIPVVGNFLGWTEQIKALTPSDRKKVVSEAASYLAKGDSVSYSPLGLQCPTPARPLRPGVADISGKPSAHRTYRVAIPGQTGEEQAPKTAGRSMTVVSRNHYANIGKSMEFPEAIELAKTDREGVEQLICSL